MRMCNSIKRMGLAIMVTLGALAVLPQLAHASCRPSDVDSAIDGAAAIFSEIVPQSREPSPFYYEFGPWVFPPVLRVHEPPAPEMLQPVPQEPANPPGKPR